MLLHVACLLTICARLAVPSPVEHLVDPFTGQLLYDEQGFVRLTEATETEGHTREDLMRLGPWVPAV